MKSEHETLLLRLRSGGLTQPARSRQLAFGLATPHATGARHSVAALTDTKLYWTGVVYFAGLLLLGVPWTKALAIAAVALASWYLNYGRRFVLYIGLTVLILGLACWIGVLPPPAEWGPRLGAFMA